MEEKLVGVPLGELEHAALQARAKASERALGRQLAFEWRTSVRTNATPPTEKAKGKEAAK